MSLTLILMRHGKSAWDDPNLADHDRPLNDRGRASARSMGDWLRARGHVPDRAVSSSSTRTGQTFAGLGLDVPVSFAFLHCGQLFISLRTSVYIFGQTKCLRIRSYTLR